MDNNRQRTNLNSMKKLIIILFLIPLSLQAQITTDKYYHASAGIVLSSGMYTLGQFSNRELNPIAPSLIAFTGGCAKEFYDSMNGRQFSGSDLLFTTVSGIATNLVLNLVWKKKKKYKHRKDPFDYEPELVTK